MQNYIPTIPKELFKYYESFADIPTNTVDYKILFNYYKYNSSYEVAVMSTNTAGSGYYSLLNIKRYSPTIKLGVGDAGISACTKLSFIK
jgi:hypothetical protein